MTTATLPRPTISRKSSKPVDQPGSGTVCSDLPSLESGDRMDVLEFFWRYSLRPDVKHAELIEGVVYVASPVNPSRHGKPHFSLVGQLALFSELTPGVEGIVESTVRLPRDHPSGITNQPQPDIMLVWDEDHGGTAQWDEDGWLTSAPDLAAEISNSSKSYDLHSKKDLYRRIGVQEYICWQVEDGRIDWWQLVDGEYVSLKADRAGVIRSVVFPGLSLDTRALLKRVPAAKLPRRPRAKR